MMPFLDHESLLHGKRNFSFELPGSFKMSPLVDLEKSILLASNPTGPEKRILGFGRPHTRQDEHVGRSKNPKRSHEPTEEKLTVNWNSKFHSNNVKALAPSPARASCETGV
jgi:hypothetical protein